MIKAAYATLEEHEDRVLEDLQTLLTQPSISATGEGVDECAQLVRHLCLDYGFDEAEIIETPGQPAVFPCGVSNDRSATHGGCRCRSERPPTRIVTPR